VGKIAEMRKDEIGQENRKTSGFTTLIVDTATSYLAVASLADKEAEFAVVGTACVATRTEHTPLVIWQGGQGYSAVDTGAMRITRVDWGKTW
jgi:hypothetical protein